MRELLIETDGAGDAARMARGGRRQRRFVVALTAPQHAELRAELNQLVYCARQKVDALLVREAADDAEQRRRGLLHQVQAPLQRRLVRRFALEAGPGIALGEMRVGHRIPQLAVDAVEDPAQHAAALAQHALEAAAALLGLDLP